jgi:hypothetical protein
VSRTGGASLAGLFAPRMLTELEINPLVATPDGLTGIDVRGVLT